MEVRKGKTVMAKACDRIIIRRSGGKFDLDKIDESGQRVKARREPLGTLEQIYEIAYGSLTSGGHVWVCDEATPDVLAPFRVR
jgi:hypothetical protein